MQKQIQQDNSEIKITRAGMEEELGDSYKRCWAIAFKLASEGIGFEEQVDGLIEEFDIIRPQANWFVTGANTILLKQEVEQTRQKKQSETDSPKKEQRELADFPEQKSKPLENYVTQLEMMSFLEDIEEMSGDLDFMEFWDELGKIKQRITEQYCATEKDVLAVFRIRSEAEKAKEANERFFDAYPISTDAWENGHFDMSGEVIY